MGKGIGLCLAATLLAGGMAWGADSCPPLTRMTAVEMTLTPMWAVKVPVLINEQPVWFRLDTSAGRSRISEAAAESLGLTRVHSNVVLVDAHGRTASTQALVKHLVLGRLDYGGLRLDIMTAQPKPNDPQGTLGADLLRAYDVDLDFVNGRMNLISPEHCAGDGVVYWPSDTLVRLPMTIDEQNNDIRFRMVLDGHEVTTVLATGMPHSGINLSVARSVYGVDEKSPGSVAVNPRDPDTFYHRKFGSLSAAGLQINHPDILMIPNIAMIAPGSLVRGGDRFRLEANMHQPDFLLGMSELRHLHVYIDYKNRMIYMTPSAPATKTPVQTVPATATP